MEKFRVFNEIDIINYLESRKNEISRHINGITEEEVLKADETEFANSYYDSCKIECNIDFENIKIDSEDLGGTEYFVYKIPFTTNINDYFRLRPNPYSQRVTYAYVEDNYLCLDIIEVNSDLEVSRQMVKQTIHNLKEQAKNLKNNYSSYNEYLKQFIKTELNNRRNKISTKEGKLEVLRSDLKDL
jgi:hypothetical protein